MRDYVHLISNLFLVAQAKMIVFAESKGIKWIMMVKDTPLFKIRDH